MYGQGGTFGQLVTPFSFATWRSSAYDFQDAHSTSGVNPLFVNAAVRNFRLCTAVGVPSADCTGASPALNAGIDILDLNHNGSTTDVIPAGAYITGNERIGRTTAPYLY